MLEVGCGAGEFIERLSGSGLRITAFDLAEACAREARRKDGKDSPLLICTADIGLMPFKDETFDICFGISILHHIDLDSAWKEIIRVCRSGARFFFSEPNMLNPQIMAQKNIPWLKRKLWDSPEETAFFRWRLKERLNSFPGTEAEVMNIDFVHPLIPECLLDAAERASGLLEKLPMIKEISGSLAIWGNIRKD